MPYVLVIWKVVNDSMMELAGLKTFFFPCGTLAKIATAATNRHICKCDIIGYSQL